MSIRRSTFTETFMAHHLESSWPRAVERRSNIFNPALLPGAGNCLESSPTPAFALTRQLC